MSTGTPAYILGNSQAFGRGGSTIWTYAGLSLLEFRHKDIQSSILK